jgi:AraC family transcriptional regulator
MGFEQIEIEFDPNWLGCTLPRAPVSHWMGGHAGFLSRSLSTYCSGAISAPDLRTAVCQFMYAVRDDRERRTRAPWVDVVDQHLRQDSSLKVHELARMVGRHPSWLGSAYRQATGEGLPEAAARFRIESASRLLRETDQSCARVALEAGFCDQSHMNRSFQRILGRLPTEVKQDQCRIAMET